jgi:hypothetical protein
MTSNLRLPDTKLPLSSCSSWLTSSFYLIQRYHRAAAEQDYLSAFNRYKGTPAVQDSQADFTWFKGTAEQLQDRTHQQLLPDTKVPQSSCSRGLTSSFYLIQRYHRAAGGQDWLAAVQPANLQLGCWHLVEQLVDTLEPARTDGPQPPNQGFLSFSYNYQGFLSFQFNNQDFLCFSLNNQGFLSFKFNNQGFLGFSSKNQVSCVCFNNQGFLSFSFKNQGFFYFYLYGAHCRLNHLKKLGKLAFYLKVIEGPSWLVDPPVNNPPMARELESPSVCPCTLHHSLKIQNFQKLHLLTRINIMYNIFFYLALKSDMSMNNTLFKEFYHARLNWNIEFIKFIYFLLLSKFGNVNFEKMVLKEPHEFVTDQKLLLTDTLVHYCKYTQTRIRTFWLDPNPNLNHSKDVDSDTDSYMYSLGVLMQHMRSSSFQGNNLGWYQG